MIELDGSFGEGGGALIRTALALSTLTGKEFRANKIRANRPEPGLKAQHLESIKALKRICNAVTNEIKIGSSELYFKPGKIKKGIYEIDIGTAGSITLSLQALVLPCFFASGKITFRIKGGTCGKWQASVDYLQNVLIPQLNRFVEKIELKILKRGYYPKGGGEIVLEISPKFKLYNYPTFSEFLNDLSQRTAKIKLVEQGKLEMIKGIVNVSSELSDKEVGERMKISAETILKHYHIPVSIRIDYAQNQSVGGEILLFAIFSQNNKVDFDNPIILGSSVLVEKNKSSEQIGKEAAESLIKEINSLSGADRHLADQLIQFMALLPGSEIKSSEITEHTKTNIKVTEQFMNIEFKIRENIIKVNYPEKDL